MTRQDRWVITEYRTAADESPIRDFIDGLERRDLADALALIKLVEERGNQLREPHSKALGDGLYELRGKQVRSSTYSAPGGA